MDYYIDREQAVDLVSRMEEDNDGTVSDDYYKGYCAAIQQAADALENMPVEKVRKVGRAEWVLTVKKGYANDYNVEAHCSKCGWQWQNDEDCVGNPKCVFGALFTNGTEQAKSSFVLACAEDRRLYDYCPVCGSAMYDDVQNKEMNDNAETL